MTTRNRSIEVTESTVQGTLRRGPAPALAADEERAIRMRVGAALPRSAPLERKGAGNEDLEIELLAMEIELYMKMRDQLVAHAARRAAEAKAVPAPAGASRAKDKIVRALRAKR